MTVTEYINSKLEKKTDDIIFVDKYGNRIKNFNYEKSQICSISYKKVAYLTIKEQSKNLLKEFLTTA